MQRARSINRTNLTRTSSSTTKGNPNCTFLINRVATLINTQENALKQLDNQDLEEITNMYIKLNPDDQKKFNNAFDDNFNTFKQSGTVNIDIAEQIKNKIKNSLKAESKFHNNQTMNTGSKRESYNECLPLHGTKPRVFEKALSKDFSRQKSHGGSHQKYKDHNGLIKLINPTHRGEIVKPYLVNRFNKFLQERQEDSNTQGELTSLPERDETDAKEMMPQAQKLQQLKNHFGRGLLPPLKLLKDEDGNSLQYKDINALFEEINAQFDEKIPKHYKDTVSALLTNNFELARERIINDAKNNANNSANNYNLVYIMIHKANSQESLIADKNLIEKLTELINDDNIVLSSKIELIISYINKFNLGEQRELVNHIVDYFICNIAKHSNVTENIKHNSELIPCLFKLMYLGYDNDNQIINLVKVVADSGNLTATLRLASYLLHSDLSIQNHDLGIQYLKKAANMGNTIASCNLGEYLIKSKNKEEVAEGIQYLKNAIEGGEKFAMYILSDYLIDSKNKEEVAEVIKYLKNAINLGYTSAMFSLGKYLINSENKKKVTEGIQHLKNAIEVGDTCSMCLLGKYLIHSKNKKEVAEGIQHLKNAIEVGHTYSMYVLGQYLINSKNKKEVAEGIQYLKNVIETGDTYSMCVLGEYLINSENKKEWEEGIQYLKNAIEAGDTSAISILSNYSEKNANNKDKEEVQKSIIAYFQQLAENGNVKAMSHLGMYYFRLMLKNLPIPSLINAIEESPASREPLIRQELKLEDRIQKVRTLYENKSENFGLTVKYFKAAANLGDVDSIKTLYTIYKSEYIFGETQLKKASALMSIEKKISEPNATFTAQEVNTVIAYYQETKSQQIFGWLDYAVKNKLNLSSAENSAQMLHDMINSQKSKYTHNNLV